MIARAEADKKYQLDNVANSIAVWQTKLLMDRKLTDAETKSLNAWLDYSDALSAVNTSIVSAENPPAWPASPAA
ncbi:hypothetical protein J2125_000906 [Erwinia toletana]|uniref:Tail fiber assembly protein n=1 Tax=Winslowiella toletana TaxID=92490 RepID=A0ABS4P4Z5_9GAMM|nr:tail fiber assembly protein [Winslowiella toletana]MBP2167714.1 hypothetical protein [Winslowiella toletana]